MKILFVFEHFYPYIGGAEELFLSLATSLSEKGHEINVVTTLHSGSLPPEELFQGIKIHRVNCSNRFLFTLYSLPKIISLAKQSDFIHTASYNAALPAFIAGILCRKKVVITFHEVWGKLWFKLPFKSKPLLLAYYCYEKMILKLPFYKYVAVSRFTFNALRSAGVNENKIALIYNGLDYTKFKNFQHHPQNNFTFCYFGRLGISKGLDVLLEAAKSFFVSHPDANLKLIIPTYPQDLFRKIQQLISESNLHNNIRMLHDLDKKVLLDEVSSSSCVIIPSYSEGFCYTAAECVAMNVPIISSGKGALKEVVGGKHIHLNELTPAAMEAAMENAYLQKWNTAGYVEFSLNESVNGYLTLYRQLVPGLN